jgi:hypothetical protein
VDVGYPAFAVAVPLPLVVKLPAAYIVPRGSEAWSRWVSDWVLMKERDGTIDSLFDHWILGEGSTPSAPRWSVARDVLGWL